MLPDVREKGLLGIDRLTREQVQAILDRARDFQPRAEHSFKKLDLLRGRMVVNLFFEASTRTRTSFEIAAKRLGADTISITAQASSVSKGESLVDTLNTLAAMRPDAITPVKRYLTVLATDVRRMIKEGKTLEEAVATAGQSERGKWELFDEHHPRHPSRSTGST